MGRFSKLAGDRHHWFEDTAIPKLMDALMEAMPAVKFNLGKAVAGISRDSNGVTLRHDNISERFEYLIVATNPAALTILVQSEAERKLFECVKSNIYTAS